MDLLQNIARHYPLTKCPVLRYLHFCIFCDGVFLYFCLTKWLILRFWPLIVYLWIIVCYDFAFCDIWLFLLQRIYIRLFCTFWWLRCWVSPHWPSHLGSGQTTTSTTDMSCYHHCNHYSSDQECQCQLTIIKSLSMVCVGQSLAFSQCNNFVSVTGLWQCCMTRDCWTLLLPSMLYGLWNTAFHLINGSDKLNHYTCSIIILTKKTAVMPWPPGTHCMSRSIQRNDYKYNNSGALVNHLADPEHLKSLSMICVQSLAFSQ